MLESGCEQTRKRSAEATSENHGVIVTKKGSIAGNLKMDADWEAAPTTVLRHGLISRLTGGTPREER